MVLLLSWIVAAAIPMLPIHSLLNDGGIRWMFNSFTSSVMSPMVIWIIIYSMVWGVYRGSGLTELKLRNLSFRKRLAIRTIIVETLLVIVTLLFLTLPSHAVLLSITGSLFTHDFIMGMIPTIAFYLLMVCITYGSITRNFPSVVSVLDAISRGFISTSWIWTPYILFMLLIHSIIYVLGDIIY